PLAFHPTNKNSVIVFNLASDPSDLLRLPVDALRQRLFVRREDLAEGEERLALKEVHLNKTPMLLPPNMLDEATAQRLGLDRGANERHWQILANLTLQEQQALRGKLM